MEDEERGEKQEEDERREAAIASTSVFHPNFKSSAVTSQQLSKFQELHRRRLQIKSESKAIKKAKESTKRFHAKELNVRDAEDINPKSTVKNPSASGIEIHGKDNCSSAKREKLTVKSESKRLQKLHWGLDTKERWERKANM